MLADRRDLQLWIKDNGKVNTYVGADVIFYKIVTLSKDNSDLFIG